MEANPREWEGAGKDGNVTLNPSPPNRCLTILLVSDSPIQEDN